MPLSRGTKLGPYEIVALVGAGGMGEVYKANDTRMNRVVAIKILHERFSERFAREVQAVAALNHPHICQLYDVGPNYLVMEFVDGAPIAPPDSARKLVDMAVQIADGLTAAHAAGIIHRDLKPDNILVGGAGSANPGRVKILDFGVAKAAASASSGDSETRTADLTVPGTTVGTVAYMSPEQARGTSVLTVQSDQFSFGIVLYELATGVRAFHRGSTPETMAAIIREEPPPLPATVPTPLRWVIERLLAKDPAERYDSTRDLLRELRQIRDRATETATAGGAIATAKPRRVWAAGTVAMAACAGFLAAAIWPLPPAAVPKMTPFATDSDIEAMPSWSPKGDRLAYVADDHGILQVFTQSLGLQTRTQMTHQKEWCSDPVWSADGTRIYFVSAHTLYSVAVAGGEPQAIFTDIRKVTISPDGKAMAVLMRNSESEDHLAFSSPPGAPLQVYSKAPFDSLVLTGSGTAFAFAPDSKSLGVITGALGRAQFWRIPLDGSPARREQYSGGSYAVFTWLADGERLIRGSTGSGESHLVLEDLRGTSYPITGGGGFEGFPAVSPDFRSTAYAAGESQYGVVEVPLDGSPARAMLPQSRQSVAPSWAPDGIHFAYSTNRNGVFEIWLRNRTDGSERRIVSATDIGSAENGFLDCAISPDGKRLAFRRDGTTHDIWISPLSGEAPVRLWDSPDQIGQRGPAWSPDSNWIAYYSLHDRKPAILRIKVGAGTAPELVAYTHTLQAPAWSPQGDLIAFRDGEQMRVVSPDGKENRVVSQSGWVASGWSTDGGSLFGIALDEKRHVVLKRITMATGREAVLSDLGQVPAAFDLATAQGTYWFRNFSAHPNGKSFLTSVYRMQVHLWLMQDFDRPRRLLSSLFQGK